MKPLDFLVIGAQKSGTTSLFRYLNEHPQIYIPASKEVPFFTRDDYETSSWKEFASPFYADAREEHLWGAVSPQYMTTSKACARIKTSMPNVRLIALLRNPVERAFSHYQMMKKRGFETRAFADAVAAQIGSTEPSEEETNNYLNWSRYGEILERYHRDFPQENILIEFTEDLKSDPQKVYEHVKQHIGISDSYTPSNIGKVFHRGSDATIIPNTWKLFVTRLKPIKFLWRLLPRATQSKIRFAYDQNNSRKSNNAETIGDETKALLIEHFRSDIELISDLAGRPPPWEDFQ